MSEIVSTVRLDDSGSADSVVARSANILLFAIISYTIYSLCRLVFISCLFWAEFQKTQHIGLLLLLVDFFSQCENLFLQGYTIFAVENLQWYIQVS